MRRMKVIQRDVSLSTCEFQSWVMVTGTGSPHLHISILVSVVGKHHFRGLLRGRVNGVISLQYSQ